MKLISAMLLNTDSDCTILISTLFGQFSNHSQSASKFNVSSLSWYPAHYNNIFVNKHFVIIKFTLYLCAICDTDCFISIQLASWIDIVRIASCLNSPKAYVSDSATDPSPWSTTRNVIVKVSKLEHLHLTQFSFARSKLMFFFSHYRALPLLW